MRLTAQATPAPTPLLTHFLGFCSHRSYSYNDYRRRNPNGRTGFAGRGTLSRWGPNHTTELLLTRLVHSLNFSSIIKSLSFRWSINDAGYYVSRNGRQV